MTLSGKGFFTAEDNSKYSLIDFAKLDKSFVIGAEHVDGEALKWLLNNLYDRYLAKKKIVFLAEFNPINEDGKANKLDEWVAFAKKRELDKAISAEAGEYNFDEVLRMMMQFYSSKTYAYKEKFDKFFHIEQTITIAAVFAKLVCYFPVHGIDPRTKEENDKIAQLDSKSLVAYRKSCDPKMVACIQQAAGNNNYIVLCGPAHYGIAKQLDKPFLWLMGENYLKRNASVWNDNGINPFKEAIEPQHDILLYDSKKGAPSPFRINLKKENNQISFSSDPMDVELQAQLDKLSYKIDQEEPKELNEEHVDSNTAEASTAPSPF